MVLYPPDPPSVKHPSMDGSSNTLSIGDVRDDVPADVAEVSI